MGVRQLASDAQEDSEPSEIERNRITHRERHTHIDREGEGQIRNLFLRKHRTLFKAQVKKSWALNKREK